MPGWEKYLCFSLTWSRMSVPFSGMACLLLQQQNGHKNKASQNSLSYPVTVPIKLHQKVTQFARSCETEVKKTNAFLINLISNQFICQHRMFLFLFNKTLYWMKWSQQQAQGGAHDTKEAKIWSKINVFIKQFINNIQLQQVSDLPDHLKRRSIQAVHQPKGCFTTAAYFCINYTSINEWVNTKPKK